MTDRFYVKFLRSQQPGILFYAQPYGKSLNMIDLNTDKKFDVDGSAMDIYFNIKNLLNTAPPLEPGNATAPGDSPYGEHIPGSGDVAGVDNVGRFFTIGVRANL